MSDPLLNPDNPDNVFACRNLHVFVKDGDLEKEIVRGVDLTVRRRERHALMGPNGSGKSTLAAALMGHPGYRVEGEIWLDGERVDHLTPHERARRGMFLGFQYPVAVPGVSVANFLRAAARRPPGRRDPGARLPAGTERRPSPRWRSTPRSSPAT